MILININYISIRIKVSECQSFKQSVGIMLFFVLSKIVNGGRMSRFFILFETSNTNKNNITLAIEIL